ncbi:MAG TPA: sigma factor, partial [Chloroflexota bacterium]
MAILGAAVIDADLGHAAERPRALSQDDFSAVYQAHVGRLYGFVFSQVGNREEAEDLTSQIFIKVYNSLARFEGRGSLEGWLYQIARV